jgi:hypothetical protein
VFLSGLAAPHVDWPLRATAASSSARRQAPCAS